MTRDSCFPGIDSSLIFILFNNISSSQRSGLPGADGRALLLLRLRALDVEVEQLELGAGEALEMRLQVGTGMLKVL